MTLDDFLTYIVVAFALAIPAAYWLRYRSKLSAAERQLKSSVESGLTEPISLHPKIDANHCISTGACVDACPEKNILGIVNGRAQLISPAKCIGHGACMDACPTSAISLVFGTEKRGVELPHISPSFETNVQGVYIAGELGGMGLIRNAVTQGREVVEYITAGKKRAKDSAVDLIIIGAGPAGLSAALQAKEDGLTTIVLEQEESFGGAILSYPRQKLVMTQPMNIPLFGQFKKREVVKEELLSLFEQITSDASIGIKFNCRVSSVVKENNCFIVKAGTESYRANKVLLAIGRRGTPRKLEIPGEESSKVCYKLLEPEQFKNKSILVVGGGDSAVEAALALCEQAGTTVYLSYRKPLFSRIKEKNEQRIKLAIAENRVNAMMESQVQEIRQNDITVQWQAKEVVIENDFVFIMIGGVLPTNFLKSIGIEMQMKHGVR